MQGSTGPPEVLVLAPTRFEVCMIFYLLSFLAGNLQHRYTPTSGSLAMASESGRTFNTCQMRIPRIMSLFRCCLFSGGDHLSDQIEELKRNPEILVSTPMRLLEQTNEGKVCNTCLTQI